MERHWHLVQRTVAITSTLAVFEAGHPERPPIEQHILDAMTQQAAVVTCLIARGPRSTLIRCA
jgi:hypothetical protein